MKKPPFIPYYFEWSREFPHIAAVDLYSKNVASEVAVMSIDTRNGDLYFVRLDHLDVIDLKRLKQIIQSRDSTRYALWDLMSNKTLPNGINALEFFHQFVQVRTLSGQIIKPGAGQRGIPSIPSEFGYKGPEAVGYSTNDESNEDHDVDYVARDEQAEDSTPVPSPKRKAGRPRKK